MSKERRQNVNGEVYDILERCDDEDLAPLVELLVSSKASVLALSRAYETHGSMHSKYVDRIGDELYRLALESMSPKDRQRPSYAAMVEAVCRKVGVPVVQDEPERNEGTLFATFGARHLDAVPPSERRAATDAMRSAISNAADSLLTVLAWPPFAAGLLEVGLLRRKHLTGGTPASATVGIVAATSPASCQTEGSLVIADEDGFPILSVEGIRQDGVVPWRGLESGDRLSSALTPILKSIEPFLAADRILANGQFVRVGIEGGAAALSKSMVTGKMVGSAIGHKGQVPFLPVAAGTVAWPLAVVMLASAYMEQKRFENIERSLDSIASAMAEVARFQQTERRSMLTGSIKYFRQMSRSILAGDHDEDFLHAIERLETDLVRVQDHLFADVEAQTAELSSIKNEKWTSGKFLKELAEEQNKLEQLIEDAATCIEVRACGFQLLCAFPGKEKRKQARYEELTSSMADLCPDGRIGNAVIAFCGTSSRTSRRSRAKPRS